MKHDEYSVGVLSRILNVGVPVGLGVGGGLLALGFAEGESDEVKVGLLVGAKVMIG